MDSGIKASEVVYTWEPTPDDNWVADQDKMSTESLIDALRGEVE